MRWFTIPSDGQKSVCGVGSVHDRPLHLTVIPRKQSLVHENATHLISGNDLCVGRPEPWLPSSHKIRRSGFGMLPCMSASHGRDWKEEEKNKTLDLIDSKCMENNRCEVKCNSPSHIISRDLQKLCPRNDDFQRKFSMLHFLQMLLSGIHPFLTATCFQVK